MKTKDKELIKIEKTLAERAKYYMKTPERAGEALLFAKQLMNFAENINKKVRETASEIMDENDVTKLNYDILNPETGEIKSWEIRRQSASMSKKYKPENVLNALNKINKDAFRFLTVKKTDLDRYLKKENAKGLISFQTIEEALKDPIETTIKGRIVVKEIKL